MLEVLEVFERKSCLVLWKAPELRCCEESGLKHCTVLPNDNFLEQEFENFNRDELGNKKPFGDDNNGEEEEKETLSYEDFNHNLVVANFLLGLSEKCNQRWRTQRMIWGSASWST